MAYGCITRTKDRDLRMSRWPRGLCRCLVTARAAATGPGRTTFTRTRSQRQMDELPPAPREMEEGYFRIGAGTLPLKYIIHNTCTIDHHIFLYVHIHIINMVRLRLSSDVIAIGNDGCPLLSIFLHGCLF